MPSSFSSLRKNLEAVVIRVEDAFDDGLLEKSPSLFTSERIRARGGGRRDAEERSVVFGLTSFATVLLRSFGETFTCAAQVHSYVQCHPA